MGSMSAMPILAVPATGFLLCNMKDENTKERRLPGGIIKRTLSKDTKTGARVMGGILTLGLTELRDHHEEFYTYHFKDIVLGAKIEEAVSKANKQGQVLQNEYKYTEALEWFEAAYQSCENRENKQAYLDNINCTKAQILNKDGNVLSNENKYSEAIVEYQKAYEICPNSKYVLRNEYRNNEAKSLNFWGLELLNVGKYSDAAEKFNAAYNRCSENLSGRLGFQSNINLAKGEYFNEKGDVLYKSKNYLEAILKYEAAVEEVKKCDLETLNSSKITSYLNKYQNNKAKSLNGYGQQLFDEGNYEGAAVKFKAACEQCTSDSHLQQEFQHNMNHAEAEILNKEGDRLYNNKIYVEAILKYETAYELCPLIKKIDKNIYLNNEAKSLNALGLELLDKEDYSGALEKFTTAVQKCIGGYSGKEEFQNNMNHAKAEILNKEGDRFYNEQNFAEAILKYKAAYNQCPSSKTFALNKYQNSEANSINSEGLNLLDCENYAEAVDKFNAAYEKCIGVCIGKKTFQDNLNHAKAEILNKEGDELFNETRFVEAILKYKAAYGQCPSCKTFALSKYQNNEANSLNSQGLELISRKDYAGAVRKFKEAYEKCTEVFHDKSTFLDNLNWAEAESLNNEGDNLFNGNEFVQSIVKYEAAISKCPSSRTCNQNKYLNHIARSFNSLGLQLLSEGNYVEAADKFNAAYEKCTNDYPDKHIFLGNMKLAKAEGFNEEGDKFYNEKKYTEAVIKYEAAYKLCPRSKIYYLNKYRDNSAKSLNAHGLELVERGDFDAAAPKFSVAFEIFTGADYIKQTFKDNMNLAIAEALNKEADILYNEEKYSEAILKYEAAYNKCPSSKTCMCSKYQNNKAKSVNAQGIILLIGGNYTDAFAKFNAAHQECTTTYSDKKVFEDNMNYANAEVFNVSAGTLNNDGHFLEAIKQYEKAYNICPTNRKHELCAFKNNKSNALYGLGLKAYDEGNYSEAANWFGQAYSECTSGFEKEQVFKYKFNQTLKLINAPAWTFMHAQHLIGEGKTDVENLEMKNTENTIVIGNSFAGKSTLINYLLSNPLKAAKDRTGKKLKIFAEMPEAGPEIGPIRQSVTTVPKKWFKQNAAYKKAIWDCPGFGDNRGPAIDMSNACLLGKLLNNARNIRIVLVSDFVDIIGDNPALFTDFIKQLKCLFGSLDQISNCCVLLVTKVDNYNADEIAAEIVHIAEDVKDPELHKFIHNLVGNKVIIFEKPKNEGFINGEDANAIAIAIDKVDSKYKLDVNIGISSKTENFILKKKYVLLDEFKECLKVIPQKLSSAIDVTRINTLDTSERILLQLEEMERILNFNDKEANIKDLIKRLPIIFGEENLCINYKKCITEKMINALQDKLDLIFFMESISHQQLLDFDDFRTSLIIALQELEKKVTVRHIELQKQENKISQESMLEQIIKIERDVKSLQQLEENLNLSKVG